MAWSLAGCATPADPDLSFVDELAPERVTLNGDYIAQVHTRWFAPMNARVTIETNDSGIKGNTPPGVAWSLIGGLERVLGPLFAPFLFPSGMLLVWTSSLPGESDDGATVEPGEGWIGPSSIDPWRARTRMTSPTGPVEVLNRDGRVMAVLTFQPASSSAIPQTDYSALTDEMESAVRSRLYDRSLAESPQAVEFFADVRRALPKVDDDLTFGAAVVLAWRKQSAMPLPVPYRKDSSGEIDPLLRDRDEQVKPISVKHDDESGITTVEVVTFQSAGEVDRAMDEAVSQRPRALVIDLRNCTGLEMSALRVAGRLLADPTDAGVMFGASRRDEALAREPQSRDGIDDPPNQDRGAMSEPIVSMDNESIVPALERDGLASLRIMPAEWIYDGPVYVLTSSRTRSTAEILAFLLQKSGRAVIVGERTPGRPRLSIERPLHDDFVIRIDEFDWIPTIGVDPNRRAVRPDIRSRRQDAPDRVRREIDASIEKPSTR
jgi:Peptidase family S41